VIRQGEIPVAIAAEGRNGIDADEIIGELIQVVDAGDPAEVAGHRGALIPAI
jgi:hypothetical protein